MRIVAGSCKGQTLRTVSGPGYRPAMGRVRESLFSLLEARGVIWSAERVLDLFAGSGSLGFEALSRGAREAVFVEQDRKAADCLVKNAAALKLTDRCRILTEDAIRATARPPCGNAPFGVIFVDPPYQDNLFPQTARNLLRLNWLAEGGWLAAEVEKHGKLDPLFARDKGLELDTDRLYGQTRILLWVNTAWPSTPELSTP